ncbi:MAG: hypothetical protein IAE95_05940 [Chitinophagaceae bacterium]|nr:hypothetical protein [Chitinophagaceae bacterium]
MEYTPDHDIPHVYKGNQFACANGLGAWSCITVIPAAVIILSGRRIDEFAEVGMLLVPLTAMLFLFFGLSSLTLWYFIADANQLDVRNHNLIFLKRTFLWGDISSVVLDYNRAELLLKNGSKKVIRAESLNNRDWLALKQHLLRIGMPVKDEVDYEQAVTPQAKRDSRRLNRGMAVLFLVITGGAAILIDKDVARWVLGLWVVLGFMLGLVVMFFWYMMGGNDNTVNDEDKQQ